MDDSYLVVFARITEDKVSGIVLQGVYFGGYDDTLASAESTAKDCINTIKGGTILPKVAKITEPHQVIDTMIDVHERFEKMTNQMIQANQIINRKRPKHTKTIAVYEDEIDE